jgi:hypothetical protein
MLVANPTKAREVGGELNGSHHSTATNGINSSKTTTEMSLHSNGVQRNSNSSSLMSSRIASTSQQQQSKLSSELKQTSLFEQTKSSKLGKYLLLTYTVKKLIVFPVPTQDVTNQNSLVGNNLSIPGQGEFGK